jgi:hypothetical protein
MTRKEIRKRKDRNKRIQWMLTDVCALCAIIVVMTGTLMILEGMI